MVMSFGVGELKSVEQYFHNIHKCTETATPKGTPRLPASTHPMDDACRVQVLDATEHLVEKVGHALVVEIHLDHLTQIGVHQLHHQITVWRLDGVVWDSLKV